MKLMLFSIKDDLTGVFLAPFVSRSEIDASRQISDSLLDSNVKTTPVGRYPSKFGLYHVGYFDDETGETEGLHPAFLTQLDKLLSPDNIGTVSS